MLLSPPLLHLSRVISKISSHFPLLHFNLYSRHFCREISSNFEDGGREIDWCGSVVQRLERPNLFVHQSSIKSDGYRSLVVGDHVEFQIGPGDDGKSKAIEVVALDGSSGNRRDNFGGGGVRGGRGGGGYGFGGWRGGSGKLSVSVKAVMDLPKDGLSGGGRVMMTTPLILSGSIFNH